MKRHPARSASRAPRRVEARPVDVVRPSDPATPFLSCHSARMQVAARDGRARLDAAHTRFENGELSTERFAGELDPTVYERFAASARQVVLAQVAAWLGMFSFFVPHPPKFRGDRD
jgi:hypothetical protein